LQKGDVLYIPPFYFHHVINEDAGISVNVWTDSEAKEAIQNVFKLVLKLPPFLGLASRLSLTRIFFLRVFDGLGIDMQTFMNRHQQQRYANLPPLPPDNPEEVRSSLSLS